MISAKDIMAKVNAWAQTPDGKKKVDGVVKDSVRTGRPLANGKKVLDPKEMTAAANDLIQIIRDNLPEPIKEVGRTLTASAPIRNPDGTYVVYINFDKDALRRESLKNNNEYYQSKHNGRTGEGINNIVALFNTGYKEDSIGRVWGMWESRGKWIHNQQSRDGLWFMQRAVQDFLSTYGGDYSVKVNLDEVYEEK